MRYKNIKTGAIIDSPFILHGDNWEKATNEAPKEKVEEEYVEEEVNLEEMTNKELDEFAEEHDVQLSSDDKKNKSTRIDAIAKAFE